MQLTQNRCCLRSLGSSCEGLGTLQRRCTLKQTSYICLHIQQVSISKAKITAMVRSSRLRRASTKVLKQLVSPATSISAANLRNLQQRRR